MKRFFLLTLLVIGYNIAFAQYVDYIPETVDLPGIQRIEVNYNTQEINKEFENH